MVRVEVGGEDPTHNQPAGNDGVRLNGVHEIDAYAFEEGRGHGVIVFNYGLHQTRRVSLEGPGLKAGADLWRLVSSGPGASNEETPRWPSGRSGLRVGSWRCLLARWRFWSGRNRAASQHSFAG